MDPDMSSPVCLMSFDTISNPSPDPEDANGVSNQTSRSVPSDSRSNSSFPKSIVKDTIHVELTYSPLDVQAILTWVRSPLAGANVLFLGTTRNSFENKPVEKLEYQSYAPLALQTLSGIACTTLETYSLTAISITHRLGAVPIGEESIAIAVSAPHRKAAWQAGEEALERCKERTEIWKREDFVGDGGEGEWRANKERDGGGRKIGGEG